MNFDFRQTILQLIVLRVTVGFISLLCFLLGVYAGQVVVSIVMAGCTLLQIQQISSNCKRYAELGRDIEL